MEIFGDTVFYGHRYSLQNKCEFGESLSVTSFAHLGVKRHLLSGKRMVFQKILHREVQVEGGNQWL